MYEHQEAFDQCKKLAGNRAMLTHFDTKKPRVLTTDAGPYGVGACWSHKVTDNGKSRLHPMAYASASLKPSKRNCAQIDGEVLGNNTYMADFGDGIMKHVSGDLLSRVPITSHRNIGDSTQCQDLSEENTEDIDDSVSVCSQSSIGSEILDSNTENVAAPQNGNRVRRRRRMVDRLDQPQDNLPRLRPLRHRYR